MDDAAEVFQIHQKSSIGVGCAHERHQQFKIMAVHIGVGAFAKYLFVFFGAPIRVPKLMGSVEMLLAGQMNHKLAQAPQR